MSARKSVSHNVKTSGPPAGMSPSGKPKAVRTIHAHPHKGQQPVSKTAMENRIFLLMNMIGATPLS
ncbi:MAG TPA: hypothetical protein VNE41_06400 [Chitinophagaceae bacterium]|nr:hypothetical protein [Chitinophagaceae bacterium]